MNEQPGHGSEMGHESQFQRLKDLPFYYQQLGRACAEVGLLEEFYWLVEAGYDFGDAYATISHYLAQEPGFEGIPEVKEWLQAKYEIDVEQDDIDVTRPKW